MRYVQVIDGTIQMVGRLPASARRLDTGQWVMGLPDADPTLREACGWLPLVDPGRPDPALDEVVTRDVALVDGIPTVVWGTRPKTDEEQFADEQAQAPDVTSALAARLTGGDPDVWTQPTGAHDAYLPGQVVLDGNGNRWRNDLGQPNVWPLDNPHAKWTDLDATEPDGSQPWVQPSGAHDAYAAGDTVTHNAQTWTSDVDGNTWEPGVHGWTPA